MKLHRRALFGALVALASLTGAWAQRMALDAEEIYERIAPSVWLVIADVGGGATSQGSAVVVAPATLITNCHVVDKAKALVVVHGRKELRAYLQYRDPTRDLCQLNAPGLDAPAVRMVSAGTLRVGAKVYAIGNPRGLELTLSDGLLSGLRRSREGGLERLQISVPISPGSSGGGLFDTQGRLVGITTSGLRDSQNLNFALPADWIVELPVRAGGTAMVQLERESPADAPRVAAIAPPVERAPATVQPVAPVPAPAPAPVPATPPPPAATVAAGTAYEYRFTERLTGATRSVVYGVEGNQADGGEIDAVMPPGGWVRADARPGDEWTLKYSSRNSNEPTRMDLRARVVREETLDLAGRSLLTLRVEFNGYTDRPVQTPGSATGRYRAVAWYSPELRRVVRFDVKSQGGMMSSKFVIDEIIELAAIR